MSFSSLDVSEPVSGHRWLRHVTVGSEALGRRADLSLVVPDGNDQLPLVILLHGIFGSHWGWAVNGGAPQAVEGLLAAGAIAPMAVVMPSDGLWGEGSAYVRHGGEDVERYVVEEVPALCRLLESRIGEAMYIGGLSMGGYGAVRLASRNPGRFRAIAGTSSVTELEQLLPSMRADRDQFGIAPGEDRLADILMELPPAQRVPLRLDCGTEDYLLEANRGLHHQLQSAGIDHCYAEFEGGHEWAYWRARLPGLLRFFDAVDRGRLDVLKETMT